METPSTSMVSQDSTVSSGQPEPKKRFLRQRGHRGAIAFPRQRAELKHSSRAPAQAEPA